MENENKYLPQLLAERDSLDSSFIHAMKLLSAGKYIFYHVLNIYMCVSLDSHVCRDCSTHLYSDCSLFEGTQLPDPKWLRVFMH